MCTCGPAAPRRATEVDDLDAHVRVQDAGAPPVHHNVFRLQILLQNFDFNFKYLACRVAGFGLRVSQGGACQQPSVCEQVSGCRVHILGCTVSRGGWGVRCRVQDAGCRVWGLARYRVCEPQRVEERDRLAQLPRHAARRRLGHARALPRQRAEPRQLA